MIKTMMLVGLAVAALSGCYHRAERIPITGYEKTVYVSDLTMRQTP